MKNFVALLIVWVAFATAPAFADFQKGYDAFDKGDYATALREFQPLAKQGDASSQFYLGRMYNNGRGVPQNYKEAVKWWKLASEQGDADAQISLASMYALGDGVTQDYIRAHMWANLAAANGNESGIAGRELAAKYMTHEQIEKAQDLAKECLVKDYKGC